MSSLREDDAGTPAPKRPRVSSSDDAPKPCVSVLMPCRNAMPWLPDCVASILAQEGLESEGGLELIVVDDSSTDGSREWLRDCAVALAAADASDASPADPAPTADDPPADRPDPFTSPVTHPPTESVSAATLGFPEDRLGWKSEEFIPLSVDEVVARRRPRNALVVLTVEAFGPSGQGLALNAAYRASRAPLVGEMESDDLRPPRAFATLRDALRANPTWDCATSPVALVGWPRPGMQRWIEWLNSRDVPERMRRGRFLEIPALRGSGLYRRRAMQTVAGGPNANPYRDLWLVDGEVRDCADADDPGYRGPGRLSSRPSGWWPVDADFWQRWYARGLVAGKTSGVPLYLWRQYPAQSTRTHDRCSLRQLRACKVHFLLAEGGPGRGRPIQVWGTGDTLDAWVEDLRGALVGWDGAELRVADGDVVGGVVGGAVRGDAARRRDAACAVVRGVAYKPGAPVSEKYLRQTDADHTAAVADAGVTFDGDASASERSPLRLFAFGMEKARAKVVKTFRGFDEEGDDHWFVA